MEMKKYLYLCLVFVMVFSLAAAAGAEDLSGKLVLYSPANEEETAHRDAGRATLQRYGQHR